MDIFAKASKKKLTFTTVGGTYNVDDLWDIPLSKLDTIAMELDAHLETASNSYLVKRKPKAAPLLQLRFDVAIAVLNYRVEADATKATAAIKAEKKRALTDLLKRRTLADQENLSTEDIEKMISEL